jgi:hypothetical protein
MPAPDIPLFWAFICQTGRPSGQALASRFLQANNENPPRQKAPSIPKNALNNSILFSQGRLISAITIPSCPLAMASFPNPGQVNNNPEMTVPDEDHGVDLPMSMTASVILTHLPEDATQALADVEAMDDVKGRWEKLNSCIQSLLRSTSLIRCTSFLNLPTSF